MTDKADPSPSSDGQAYMVAQAIQQFGAVGDGWIVPSGESYAADHANSGISGAPLGAFAHVNTSGLDVTFDTGEAFVGGAWCARDTQTTITLADNTSDQSVVVAWDYNDGDALKIGVPGASPGATFNTKDPRVPLYTFDTSNGAVSSTADDRTVDKAFDLAATTFAPDSELQRFLMTAASSSTHGTPGDSAGELWRAGSSTSDMLMSIRGAGSDRANLCWNAYYDAGTSDWKFINGGENAYRIAFGSGGVSMYTADGSSAADGDVISWHGYDVLASGELTTDTGETVFDDDNSEVPQGNLGGPAQSLSNYPLPASDINDGHGSGLDADTVDGQEGSALGGSGIWSVIDTYEDTDTSTHFDYDSGVLSTTYDVYKIWFVFESLHAGDNEIRMRVNNDSSSSYDTYYYGQAAEISVKGNHNAWQDMAKTDEKYEMGHGEATVRGNPLGGQTGSPNTVSMAVDGVGHIATYQALSGQFEEDVETVDRLQLFSQNDAIGKLKLSGQNL